MVASVVTGTLHVPCMPSLLPDELLYSLLGRLVLLNALERPKFALRRLLGGHLALASVDLTTRLAQLHARLAGFAPAASAMDLLERSTLFPYHRAFLPLSRCKKVEQALLHGPASGLTSLMGLAANGFGAATQLRYCPQCAREDHHRHGTSYWHRAHHLPGVQVCRLHGLSLIGGVIPSRSGNKHALRLPPWDVAALDFEFGASPIQLRFAQLCAHALHRPATPTTEDHRCAVYQHAAIDLGYAGARARIDYEHLADALLAHHARFEGFEHRARLMATEKTPLAWLRPLLTRPQRAMHPICHLVLIDFLFGDWQTYEEALGEWPALPPVVLVAPTIAAEPSAGPNVEADAVLDPSLTCRQAAQRSGLCVTTVATRRRAAGMAVSSRRKTVCGPVIERVRELVLKGVSPALIAERTGVSMSTAYRIRREHAPTFAEQRSARNREAVPSHRDAWLALGRQQGTAKRARKSDPACYAWLYRNDREWLAATNATFAKPTRSHQRVDWAARDLRWSDCAAEFACSWRDRRSRARLSPSAVMRSLGEWAVRKHRHQLPLLVLRIAAVTQTRTAYQLMRMSEAVSFLSKEGADLVSSRVLKRAGLRKLPHPIFESPSS